MSAQSIEAWHQRWRFLALLFVLAAAVQHSSACPKSCACYVPTEVHCTFRYLTAIPTEIQPSVERINLGYNSLTVLKENDLTGLEHLELLMLHSNTIQNIEDRAFHDLKSLQVLKMSYNRVKQLNKDTFQGLDNLVRLHMDHNHIQFINPEAFYGLTALHLVHLEGNMLQQLHPDTFTTLRHSQVFQVSSVKTIYLSDNALTSLPMAVFNSCHKLENLFLHGNPWSCDCKMEWFAEWARRNPGVLKCKRDRNLGQEQLCPVCQSPMSSRGRGIVHLSSDEFACSKPWILPHLKQKNISIEEGDYTPVVPKDFLAPIGNLQMNITDQFHNDANVACVAQKPSGMDNLTVTQGSESDGIMLLSAMVTTSLVCNIDYEHIQQLWSILATYSDTPMRLERGLLLSKTPEMIYQYKQVTSTEDDVFTAVEANIKLTPGWLMQNEITLQLDRTTTTYSTLHIKYRAPVQLYIESKNERRGRYGWALIKRDNQTKTEHSVLIGGMAELNCQIQGEPKPSLEWILPDGTKVRAPYYSEDRRIIISDSGKLTLRTADSSDAGIYRCIATNYLDADVLIFRINVLSQDMEEGDVNGIKISRSIGESLTLDCISSGSPEASAQWILPDHSVVDKSYGNRKLYRNGTLRIQELTERDRGFYRCVVANYLGADLLASQVTVNVDGTKRVIFEERDGSGDDNNPIYDTDNQSLHISQKSGQESRTITSDRPYPRHRTSPGWGSGRRGNRRFWGNRRVFDKVSRRVDPQKIAEFIKKAQTSKSAKDHSDKLKSNVEFSGDGDGGSGERMPEDDLVISPSSVMTSTDTAHDSYASDVTTTANDLMTVVTTEEINTVTTSPYLQTDQMPKESRVTVSNHEIQRDETTAFKTSVDHTTRPSESKPPTLYRNMRKHLTLNEPITLRLTVTDTTDEMQVSFSGDDPETTTDAMPLVNIHYPNVTPMMDGPAPRAEPVVHTSTDPESQTTFTAVTTTERERDEITFHTTQRIKSPRLPPGSTIISRQQIHIIPPNKKRKGSRRNFPGRRRIIRPNRITDIQSYLDKLRRPSVKHGGNATVPYTVELTTDCNEEKGGEVTSTTNSKTSREQTTARPVKLTRSDVPRTSSQKTEIPVTSTEDTPVITSALDYSLTSTSQPMSTAHGFNSYTTYAGVPYQEETEETLITTTPTTTTTKSSKIIRGKIPWHRLFGGKEGQREILNRLRKPVKPPTVTVSPTTAQTVTTTETARTATQPTAETLVAPMTAIPSIPKRDRVTAESSTDDLPEFPFATESHSVSRIVSTTVTPSSSQTSHTPTTAPLYESRSSSTTESSPVTQTLPAPPTTRPVSKEDAESSSSGFESGGSGRWFTERRWRNRKPGFRGRGFRVRRPVKVTTPAPISTTTDVTDMTTTFEITTPAPKTASRIHGSVLSKPLYTPSRETERSFDTSDPFRRGWGNPLRTSTTNRPKIFTTTMNPTTYPTTHRTTISRLRTTAQTRIHTNTKTTRENINMRLSPDRNGRFPTQSSIIRGAGPTPSEDRGRGYVERIRPTASPTRNRERSEEKSTTLTFDTLTVLTAEQGYAITPAPNSFDNALSNRHDHIPRYETTTSNILALKPFTEEGSSRPRILGGNAASFTVLSNSDAFLPCEAAGNPEPTITWKRFSSNSGITLTIKGKMGKFEVFKNGTLFIQNANIKDRGQYLCLAENDRGSDKLLVTLSVVAYPSRILEPKVRDIKAHAGNKVEMKCKAEGRPMPSVSWILANRTQVRGENSEHGRVTVTPEGTLVIQHVSVYDRGHYKCIASNPAGADTATVRLQVVAAPPGILEEKRQQVKGSAGQSIWLACTAQGDPQPTVHWVLFDGTVVQPSRSTDTKASVFANGTLHLRDLATTDSGVYECIATSTTGSERRVVTLTVEKTETAPQIIETSRQRTQLEYGDRLLLNCSATGDPQPRILWRLPSKALVDQWHRMGSRIHVLENGTLIIDTVSEKDAGNYLCVARSKVGDDLQILKVSVSMKPAKIEPKIPGKKHVPYGKDIKVDCKASGAPLPEISWGLPDGTVVNSALQADSSGGGRSKRYTLFNNGTLFLNQVGMAQEGDYTCYAENTLGKDEMHVHITVVTAAPRIREPNLTYAKVKPGGNIRFDCEAVGEPKPKVLWMLPSNDMIAASNDRYLMHVNGSLDIRDVKLGDAGEYVCMARNAAGEESNVYKLDIDGNPPVINGYYQNRTVIKDTAAKYSRKLIDCNAEGDPPPQITWIMPDNIFLPAPYYGSRINVHRNGTLEIRNVRPTDTAEFICMARNDGGEAVMVVQLEVTTMLRRPIFKNPFNERVVTRMGKTTLLNCSADGLPAPEITWVLPNGTRASGPHRGPRHHLFNDGSFVIYNPSKEDSGKYRCAAKNSMGYIEKLIVLEVGQKPYILTRPRGVIRSVSGEPLFLHCLTDGSPRPSIFWTLPGGLIVTRSHGRYKVMDNGTLIIHETTPHDRGSYQCRAKNDAGEAVLTVPVTIIAYPPRITNGPPSTLKAVAGTPIQLNCVTVGVPKPEITWELPDRSVLSTAGQGRPTGSELLHPQGTLIVQRPTRADSGMYKCLAKNHLGTDTRVTYVRIM